MRVQLPQFDEGSGQQLHLAVLYFAGVCPPWAATAVAGLGWSCVCGPLNKGVHAVCTCVMCVRGGAKQRPRVCVEVLEGTVDSPAQ